MITKKRAIAYFGNAKKLADALEITQGAVSQWVKYVPLSKAYELEVITFGKLKVGKIIRKKSRIYRSLRRNNGTTNREPRPMRSD